MIRRGGANSLGMENRDSSGDINLRVSPPLHPALTGRHGMAGGIEAHIGATSFQ